MFAPPDPWPRDAELGRRMVASGESLAWGAAAETGEMGAHRFGWLGDLRAAGGDAARARGQSLVKVWIRRRPQGLATALNTRRCWRTHPRQLDRAFRLFRPPGAAVVEGPFFKASRSRRARSPARRALATAGVRALHAGGVRRGRARRARRRGSIARSPCCAPCSRTGRGTYRC
ncbi:MAG: hypothetical protein U1F37_15415 [Alphaproteobacteria bacterium]